MAAITPEKCWQAVFNREPHFDGVLVYGVTSTGIYCRPSCPSRRPKKDRVVIFPRPEAAEQAGFRPCRRCRASETGYQNGSEPWVQDLCRHIEGEDSPDSFLRRYFRLTLMISNARPTATGTNNAAAICALRSHPIS